MNKLSFILIILLLTNCKADYKNKPIYSVKVGETVDLYISENSCCINCWINDTSAKSIKFLNKKIMKSADKNCEGCTSHFAWVFKGIKSGTDTIAIATIPGGHKCNDFLKDSLGTIETFIVKVTE